MLYKTLVNMLCYIKKNSSISICINISIYIIKMTASQILGSIKFARMHQKIMSRFSFINFMLFIFIIFTIFLLIHDFSLENPIPCLKL